MAKPLAQLEGKYEILGRISERGMGAIYRVRHRLLDEVRAVKILRPHLTNDEGLRENFLREARMAIRLRHPNVVQIHDFSIDDHGTGFIVMEHIEGLTLEQICRQDVFCSELASSVVFAPGFVAGDAGFEIVGVCGANRFESPGFLRAQRGVVEQNQQLTCSDDVAFAMGDLDDTPADFGR